MEGRLGLGLLIVLDTILAVTGGEGGILGYKATDLESRGTPTIEDANIKDHIIILEPARVIFSEGRKITKITSFWERPGDVRFQTYRLSEATSDQAAFYTLTSQTELLRSGARGLISFESGIDGLVIEKGDVIAFYFKDVNPIPYFPITCNDNDYSTHMWWSNVAGQDVTVGNQYFFIAAQLGSHQCKKYYVAIETQPTYVLGPDVKYLGSWSPAGQHQLDQSPGSSGSGMLIVPDPAVYVGGQQLVMGWRAKLALPNAKVRFVVLQSVGDGLTFFVLHLSEEYYVFEEGELDIWHGVDDRAIVFGDIAVGIYTEGLNPVPYELTTGCDVTSHSLQMSVSDTDTLTSGSFTMERREENPCRNYALQLLYTKANITGSRLTLYVTKSTAPETEQRTTTILGQSECEKLEATSTEQNGESVKAGEPAQPQKIRPYECWLFVAPDGMFPRVKLLQNTLKNDGECTATTKNKITFTENRHSTAVRHQVCEGYAGETVDACTGNVLFMIIEASIDDITTQTGVRFSYRAVSQDVKSCDPIQRPGSGGGNVDRVTSSAMTLHMTSPLILLLLLHVIYII